MVVYLCQVMTLDSLGGTLSTVGVRTLANWQVGWRFDDLGGESCHRGRTADHRIGRTLAKTEEMAMLQVAGRIEGQGLWSEASCVFANKSLDICPVLDFHRDGRKRHGENNGQCS
ncbi:hypothetical protein VFPPC_17967 [Pochonia chlamydosporia 170]|uniref:Uncharacterized protein n=1 Tax=Pochonia chlamydosporia 170 TaxID=1380566 RepID=A0A219APU7_METCM|nr:hypothetical protein VFPPC_17967 [Pochonia chlamydosporia 170]OWT42840.1 hypothetical protein VFPPC_17967 [Pochonia chlamydosporia 170]